MIMKKRFFLLASVVSVALLAMSCSGAESASEQSESVVTLSGNAYITASPESEPAFIDDGDRENSNRAHEATGGTF